MAIDTAKVQGRRTLKFSSLQDVLADAERMSAGNVRVLGNWSAGQIFQHLATSLNDSIDGSDVRFPWYLTIPARLMKKKLINGFMSPGFKLPPAAAEVLEPAPTSTEAGLSALRSAIARVQRDPRRAINPVFGVITDEEWTRIHLAHAALHLSFLVPASA